MAPVEPQPERPSWALTNKFCGNMAPQREWNQTTELISEIRITSLNLLATLLLKQPRILLAIFVARAHC